MATGSSNTTDRAAWLQWNDMFTMKGVDGLHRVFIKYFNQLKRDRPVSPRWVYYHAGPFSAQFYREAQGQHFDGQVTLDSNKQGYTVVSKPPSASSAAKQAKIKDPVIQRLVKTDCKAAKGYGQNGRTLIRIAMYGWVGDRGIRIAQYVAAKKRQGCNIAVIISSGGGNVVKVLKGAGVPVQSADYDFPDDPATSPYLANFYSHQKFMTLSGTYAGKSTRTVWTGSENWSGMSFRNDELTLQIDRMQTYWNYFPQWNYVWDRATHCTCTKPTGMP